MSDTYIKNILNENKTLKMENKKLKKRLTDLENKINSLQEDLKSDKLLYSKEGFGPNENQQLDKLVIKNYQKDIGKNADEEYIENMSIISFLARSYKRVPILKSLSQNPKIPSIIGNEIGDSSHHVSKSYPV